MCVCIYSIYKTKRNVYADATLHFYFSQQVKWNHFIMTSVYMCYRHIFVVSSRRNKTNPHHRNKFIPVLNATHLQAFKPKLSIDDQLLKTDQQDVSLYICVCVSWNIFNRIHFFAICDVFSLCNSFVFMWYSYMIIWKVDEAASTNFFFSSYTIYFHIANRL
jgi:hypothetical protein